MLVYITYIYKQVKCVSDGSGYRPVTNARKRMNDQPGPLPPAGMPNLTYYIYFIFYSDINEYDSRETAWMLYSIYRLTNHVHKTPIYM